MSKRKDKLRAKEYLYRDGRRIPTWQWNRQQKIKEEASENESLGKIGLVRGASTIIIPGEDK